MTSSAIQQLFAERGVQAGHVRTRSDSYALPTYRWLIEEAPIAWSKAMRRMGVRYYDGSYVCRHITLQCCLACLLWHAESNPDVPDPLAMGPIQYQPDEAGLDGHARVAAITDAGIIILEPQRSTSGLGSCLQEKTLSAGEWQSPLFFADLL